MACITLPVGTDSKLLVFGELKSGHCARCCVTQREVHLLSQHLHHGRKSCWSWVLLWSRSISIAHFSEMLQKVSGPIPWVALLVGTSHSDVSACCSQAGSLCFNIVDLPWARFGFGKGRALGDVIWMQQPAPWAHQLSLSQPLSWALARSWQVISEQLRIIGKEGRGIEGGQLSRYQTCQN